MKFSHKFSEYIFFRNIFFFCYVVEYQADEKHLKYQKE